MSDRVRKRPERQNFRRNNFLHKKNNKKATKFHKSQAWSVVYRKRRRSRSASIRKLSGNCDATNVMPGESWNCCCSVSCAIKRLCDDGKSIGSTADSCRGLLIRRPIDWQTSLLAPIRNCNFRSFQVSFRVLGNRPSRKVLLCFDFVEWSNNCGVTC